MRIVFMGTPDFSVPALAALTEAGHEIVCVYTQPPRPAGRGKSMQKSAVHKYAENKGLTVKHPVSVKSVDQIAEFKALEADIGVVVAYGQILPKDILDAPKRGCLNIHASLLPRWRGAAPIQRAIMAGDTKSGVCIMQMDEGLDTGPVLLQKETDISVDDTAGTLHDRLGQIGAEAIVKSVNTLDDLEPTAQSNGGVTYAQKILKSETRVDWNQPAEHVAQHIRGLSPFPGAWSIMNDERIKLHHAFAVQGDGAPGEVIDDLTVACSQNAVSITQLQRSGKKSLPTREALRGFELADKFD